MPNFNVPDEDQEKLKDYLNKPAQDERDRQTKVDALNKMMAQHNPDLDNMMQGMAMGGIAPIGALGEAAGGEMMGVAQKYTPEALQASKEAVNDAMVAAKDAYWDPAVKQAQSRFNTLTDIMRQRSGK